MRRCRSWSKRQLKKVRWKKSLERAKRRGDLVYGGFVVFDDELLLESKNFVEAEWFCADGEPKKGR